MNCLVNTFKDCGTNMKTFEELERLAYMSNQPQLAALYAQLHDDEELKYENDELHNKVSDLQNDCEYAEGKVFILEDKIEDLEKKLEKIADIVNE